MHLRSREEVERPGAVPGTAFGGPLPCHYSRDSLIKKKNRSPSFVPAGHSAALHVNCKQGVHISLIKARPIKQQSRGLSAAASLIHHETLGLPKRGRGGGGGGGKRGVGGERGESRGEGVREGGGGAGGGVVGGGEVERGEMEEEKEDEEKKVEEVKGGEEGGG